MATSNVSSSSTLDSSYYTTSSQKTAASSSGSSTTGTSATDMANSFLKLLTTQLQNQDPLNPMDNAQMTSQLAQINTVSGIQQLNTTLNSMMSAFSTGQSLQAASMIGKGVLTAGSTLALSNNQAIGGVTLDGDADSVKVSIYDNNGSLVATEDLGAQKAGSTNFVWDGKTSDGTAAASGTYTFKVQATQGTNDVKATALMLSTVQAVVLDSSGYKLDLGSNGQINSSAVKQIL